MSTEHDLILAIAVWISCGLLVVALAGAFYRIARGPSLADRVVALDLLALLTICFIGVYAVMADQAAYLDVAIALALVAFLGTVAFARYAERRDEDGSPKPQSAEVSGNVA